ANMSEVAREKEQPRPIEADLKFSGEGWQFEKIDAAPNEPGDEAGQMQAEQFRYGGMSTNGAKFAKQLKGETFGRLALADTHDILRALAAFAFGELAGGGGRLSIVVVGDDRAITDGPGVGRAAQAKVCISEQASFFLRGLHAGKDRGGRIANG